MSSSIFVECNADRALIASLGVTANRIIHSSNLPEVCKAVMKKQKTIGIVDEDPQGPQPSYLKNLTLLHEDDHFRILIDKRNDSRLIVLRPRLENWILRACLLSKVQADQFKLPHDARKLHETVNANLSKFQELLIVLKQRSALFKQLENYLKTPQ